MDRSNGYEAIASHFLRARTPTIGPENVRRWVRQLEAGSTVLELACGFGLITEVLVEANLDVYALDASPTLVAEFRKRFPEVPVQCEAAEESTFFERTFDAIVAWGLLFLLPEDTQRELVRKMAMALNPGGHLLFTSEREFLEWEDSLTGRRSVALGFNEYVRLIETSGLEFAGDDEDFGGNVYYFARKPQSP